MDLPQADSTSRIVDATSDVKVGLLNHNAGASTCHERFLDAELSEGLSHLADGPVFIAGGNAERAARSSAPDRAAAVLGSHQMIKRLTQMRP
ncbi:MAG: hypothetical protein U1C73_14855 [Dietzia sp.]|nr:hypothetical protein [Dietzia sp.]